MSNLHILLNLHPLIPSPSAEGVTEQWATSFCSAEDVAEQWVASFPDPEPSRGEAS